MNTPPSYTYNNTYSPITGYSSFNEDLARLMQNVGSLVPYYNMSPDSPIPPPSPMISSLKDNCVIDLTDDDDNSNMVCTTRKEEPQVLFVYPPNCKDSVRLTQEDYDRLAPGNELNDNVIDTYLRYYRDNIMDSSTAKRFQIFNSFFYLSLQKDNIGKWTKGMDIFNYDYLIIPISENHHWKLAIIANMPQLLEPNEKSSRPYILLFDSLGVENKNSPIFDNLRSYLEREWRLRKNETRDFSKHTVRAFAPRLPCQNNSTDCGLFLIKYVIEFTKSIPVDFSSRKTIKSKIGKEWFQIDDILELREEIKNTFLSLAQNNK